MGEIWARGAQCLMGGKLKGEIWGPFCLEMYRKQHPGEEGVTSKAALKIYPGQNHMAAGETGADGLHAPNPAEASGIRWEASPS